MVGKQGAEATRQAETASTTGPRRSRGRSPDDGLRLFCILHPASTTHRQLSDEERLAARAGPDVIRLSVGIEDVADLIADLEHALSGALESTASR